MCRRHGNKTKKGDTGVPPFNLDNQITRALVTAKGDCRADLDDAAICRMCVGIIIEIKAGEWRIFIRYILRRDEAPNATHVRQIDIIGQIKLSEAIDWRTH